VMLNDGYIPDPDFDPVPAIDYLFDLSYAFPSGSIYENSPNFAVRIGAVHATGGSDFVSSHAGTTSADDVSGYTNSTSQGGGTVRYDLVKITGIPEPTTIALAVCGLAMMGAGRRK
ncbi:MAG: PEP-CTERM sorting domain-containing protein, partial [Bythopirellula sp.]